MLTINSDDALDTDDPEHITWLYQTALERARKFDIPGVTYSMTQGVVKNIIPAIASTNAIIAAACTSEALKLASNCNPFLENYMMYAGEEGVYTYTFEAERKPDCPVCGTIARKLVIDPETILEEFIEGLAERPEAQLKKPSLRTEAKTLYQRSPPQLEEMTRPNLRKKICELVEDGEEIAVTDPAFQIAFKYKITYA